METPKTCSKGIEESKADAEAQKKRTENKKERGILRNIKMKTKPTKKKKEKKSK